MRHVFIILCILVSVGDMPARIMSDSVTVYFPVSRSNLETGYMDNGIRLDTFMCHIDSILLVHPAPIVRNVEVYGAASPEGSYEFDRLLSGQRADEILKFLGRKLQIPDSVVSVRYAVRNWKVLRSVLGSDSLIPGREAVMSLLDSNLSYVSGSMTKRQSDRLLQKIRSLDNGKPYRMMLKKIFPFLREASLIITFYSGIEKIRPDSLVIRPKTVSPDTIPLRFSLPEFPEIPESRTKWALRTNMLLDVFGVPGIGAELSLGQHLSLQGEWMYAWWSHRADNFFWRLYGGDIGVRWWFGKQAARRRLSGHHIGVYAQALIWDFEFGKRGYMGGVPGDAIWQRANIGAGVEYGYSLPVADRWNIDFCIGIGYLGGSYREYLPLCGQYVWQRTKNLNYVGPTKAEIALVYRF